MSESDNKHQKQEAQSDHADQYDSLVLMASGASVITALTLIVIKVFAWVETDSSGVLVSLIDSSIDGLSSIISLFVLRYALAPADEDHRFGHGKAEAIACLGQAAFIFGSAGFLILHAFERMLHPKVIHNTDLGIGIIGASIVLTIALVIFQKYVIKKTGSQAIAGDSLHYSSDLIMNLAVIAGLFLASQGFGQADPAIALIVGIYIIYNAYRLGQSALHSLLDRELDLETQQEIGKVALSHHQVKGVHDLRTRDGGKTIFIQMHLEMPDNLKLLEAHDICDRIEEEILNSFPNADIIIHLDPISAVNEEIIVPFEEQPITQE
jgi:ferrous-iron efflux pump FieF